MGCGSYKGGRIVSAEELGFCGSDPYGARAVARLQGKIQPQLDRRCGCSSKSRILVPAARRGQRGTPFGMPAGVTDFGSGPFGDGPLPTPGDVVPYEPGCPDLQDECQIDDSDFGDVGGAGTWGLFKHGNSNWSWDQENPLDEFESQFNASVLQKDCGQDTDNDYILRYPTQKIQVTGSTDVQEFTVAKDDFQWWAGAVARTTTEPLPAGVRFRFGCFLEDDEVTNLLPLNFGYANNKNHSQTGAPSTIDASKGWVVTSTPDKTVQVRLRIAFVVFWDTSDGPEPPEFAELAKLVKLIMAGAIGKWACD